MTEYDVKRLALILAVQAEIEGAKLDNKEREHTGTGFSIGWNFPPQWFDNKAMELRNLAYTYDGQL
jgi:hypothetical protein